MLQAGCPQVAVEAAALQTQLSSSHEALLRADPSSLAGANLEDFVRAASVALSRAFGVRTTTGESLGRVLLPLADLLNHGGDTSNCALRLGDDHDTLHVVAVTPLSAGDEATLCYAAPGCGDDDSASFLLWYGFVPAALPPGEGGSCSGERVTLFDDAPEALAWHVVARASAWRDDAAEERGGGLRARLAACRAAVRGAEVELADATAADAATEVAAGGAADAQQKPQQQRVIDPRLRVASAGQAGGAAVAVDLRLVAAFTAARKGDAAAAADDVRARAVEMVAAIDEALRSAGEAGGVQRGACVDAAREVLRRKRALLSELL